MALITCTNCGKNYSNSVTLCPHCGHKPTMRICPECGNVCGLTTETCSQCGYELNSAPWLPATSEDIDRAYLAAENNTNSASTVQEWTSLNMRFVEFGQYKEAEQNANRCIAEIQYIETLDLLEKAKTSDDWKQARDSFLSLGSFRDAEDKITYCNEKIQSTLYTEALSLEESAHVDVNRLAMIYAEIGDYRDAKTRLDNCLEQIQTANHKKKKKIKLLVGGACAVIMLAVFAVFSILWLIPYLKYQSAEKAFANGDFVRAEQQYIAAGDFEDAARKSVVANKAAHYSNAEKAFADGDYILAHDEFILADDYQDAAHRAAESILANHYTLGMSALNEKNYETAIQEFIQADGYGDSTEKSYESYYLLAEDLFGSSRYYEAAEAYKNSNGYSDASIKLMEAGKKLLTSSKYSDASEVFSWSTEDSAPNYKAYADGMINFTAKQYKTAQNFFNKAAVENSEEMITTCDLMLAEEALAAGKLNTALKIYQKLPEDFAYDGISVSDRLSTLDKYSSFVKICGEWSASKNYIESRNVYNYSGSWDNWYYDDNNVLPGKISVYCTLNEDGTMTISGSVSFYRFTDYSSLAAYCDATSTTKSFTIKNVTSIPRSYAIDSNTTLKFSNGVFKIEYSVRDDYSVNFHNFYNSSVTYGKEGVKY